MGHAEYNSNGNKKLTHTSTQYTRNAHTQTRTFRPPHTRASPFEKHILMATVTVSSNITKHIPSYVRCTWKI